MTDIEVVVFDVLGTMVDEPAGIRAAIADAVPDAGAEDLDDLLQVWQEHVAEEQARISEGRREFVGSDVIDREAAGRVAERAAITEAVLDHLATASQRLEPWPDSVSGLDRLAARFPVVGLSNASRSTLLRLNAHAGLRWHQALSAEDARTYKPGPEVYGLAVTAAACPPERMLMVAAHAWDLRGAQAVGMRTAYVRRPVGDPPTDGDDFDWRSDSLQQLVEELTAG